MAILILGLPLLMWRDELAIPYWIHLFSFIFCHCHAWRRMNARKRENAFIPSSRSCLCAGDGVGVHFFLRVCVCVCVHVFDVFRELEAGRHHFFFLAGVVADSKHIMSTVSFKVKSSQVSDLTLLQKSPTFIAKSDTFVNEGAKIWQEANNR